MSLSLLLRKHNKVFRILIALVWFVNGLLCKVLDLVPRHGLIVDRILGVDYGDIFTFLIGLGEIIIGIWVLTGFKTKLNLFVQIGLVATMNILEFILVPDLLLWGSFNSLFALMFIFLVLLVENYKPNINCNTKIWE